MALHIYSCVPLGLIDTPYGHIRPTIARHIDTMLEQAAAYNDNLLEARIDLAERAMRVSGAAGGPRS